MKQLLKLYLFSTLFLLIATVAISQNQFYKQKNAVSFGVNFVNDSYTSSGGGLLGLQESWNFSNPLYFGYTKPISNYFNFHGMITTNKYQPGKLVDGSIINDTRKYFALDAMGQLDLSFINENWYPLDAIKPFLTFGLGYTSIKSEERPNINGRSTFNYGFGFNFWFYSLKEEQCNCLNRFSLFDNLGITFQALGKNSFDQSKSGRQVQIITGLNYKF